MDGRDGIFKPKKYNSLYFLSAPEAKKVPDIYDSNNSGSRDLGNPNNSLIRDKALLDSTEAALLGIIGKKQAGIDKKFGKGSAEWLQQNLQMFDPEERYKLYYMFEGLTDGKINADLPTTPNNYQSPNPLNAGGVRG